MNAVFLVCCGGGSERCCCWRRNGLRPLPSSLAFSHCRHCRGYWRGMGRAPHACRMYWRGMGRGGATGPGSSSSNFTSPVGSWKWLDWKTGRPVTLCETVVFFAGKLSAEEVSSTNPRRPAPRSHAAAPQPLSKGVKVRSGVKVKGGKGGQSPRLDHFQFQIRLLRKAASSLTRLPDRRPRGPARLVLRPAMCASKTAEATSFRRRGTPLFPRTRAPLG